MRVGDPEQEEQGIFGGVRGWDPPGRSGHENIPSGEARVSQLGLCLHCLPRDSCPGPIPQLTVQDQHFGEFPDVPGEAAPIHPEHLLLLRPLMVTECALGPGLQGADVRAVVPGVGLQHAQPERAVGARPAAVGKGRDLEVAEAAAARGRGQNVQIRGAQPAAGRARRLRRRKEENQQN